jgi:hypothetical protein
MGQKKVKIFSRKFRKSLAKQFLEIAYKKKTLPFQQVQYKLKRQS